MKNHLLFIILISSMGYGQMAGGIGNINGLPKNIPSPNAASLGEYGQIPVNLFTGLPNISIPLLQEGVSDVDLSLSYRASGIHPDQHSGWTGVGWNLNCGGSITRVVNGTPDEMEHPNYSPSRYYQLQTVLDNSSWSTLAFLENYIDENFYLPYYSQDYRLLIQDGLSKQWPYPDEFVFNFNGVSGSFYYNHKGKWIVKSDQNIHINILETVSSFNLTETAPQPYNGQYETYTIPIARIFYGFEITMPDGTVYVFGKTPESVEFNSTDFLDNEYHTNYVASTWYLTKVIKPNNKEVTFEYERDNRAVFRQSVGTSIYYQNVDGEVTQASIPKRLHVNRSYLTYLSKVEFDTGEIIFNKSLSNELQYEFWLPTSSYGASSPGPGISPWINITSGWDKTYNATQNTYYHHPSDFYQDEYEATGPNLRVKPKSLHWYKLDNIHLKDIHGNTIKEIDFHYTENPSSRLFLDSIVEVGKYQSDFNPKKHSFQYNQTPLPDYNSQLVDHWGYYNSPDSFFDVHSAPYTIDDVPGYFNSRQPNAFYTQAGVLTDIIYPTGGKTSFEYEGNAYGKIVEKVSGTVNTLSVVNESGMAGGLRIQKITSDALNPSGPPIVKTYFYVLDYKNNYMLSSGILSGRPNYLEKSLGVAPSSAGYYWYWNSYSVEPMAFTSGSQITYSKVVEKTSTNNGYVEYTYSNHDNPLYRDEVAKAYRTSNSEQWKYYPITDRSFERGKLLHEKYYDKNKVLVKNIDYTYNTVTNSTDNSVRALDIVLRQGGMPYSPYSNAYITGEPLLLLIDGPGVNACVFEIPTDFKYLSKKEETDYSQGAPISLVTEYAYNSKRLLSEVSTTDSKDNVLKTFYYYPSDYNMANYYPQGYYTSSSSAISSMNAKNMISYPLGVTESKNGALTKSTLYSYSYDLPNQNVNLSEISSLKVPPGSSLTPTNLTSANFQDYTKEFVYHEYDDYANLIEASKADGTHIVYIWGYNHSKIIAKIENATYLQVENVLSNNSTSIASLQALSNLDNDSCFRYGGYPCNELNLFTALNNLRNMLPSSAMVTTYTYNPLVGVTSITDPKEYTSYYEYDAFNRLSYIKDQDFKVIEKYVYQYKNQ